MTKPNLLRTRKRRDYSRKPLIRTAGRKDRRPEQQLSVSKITMVLVLQLWLGQLLLHHSGRVRKARPIRLLLVLRVKSVVGVKNVLLNRTALRFRDEKCGVVIQSQAVRKKHKVRNNQCRPQNRKKRKSQQLSAGKKLMQRAKIKVDLNAALLDFTF